MNKLVQKIAFTTLVSGSCLLPFATSPVQARPVDSPVYDRTEVHQTHPASHLPSYISTSEYCETTNAKFSGVWTRRGNSPVYDAVWTDDHGERVYGTVEVVENHNGNLSLYYQAGHHNGYYQVRYDGRDAISGTWKGDNGRLWGSVTAFVRL
jgi:hypothetical protein